jgi:hypothetical protein
VEVVLRIDRGVSFTAYGRNVGSPQIELRDRPEWEFHADHEASQFRSQEIRQAQLKIPVRRSRLGHSSHFAVMQFTGEFAAFRQSPKAFHSNQVRKRCHWPPLFNLF